MLASALHLALTGLAIVAALMFALWVMHCASCFSMGFKQR